MKNLLLTQHVLTYAAKDPKNHPELRQMLADAKKLRDKDRQDYEARKRQIDGFIERMGIALGEVSL